MLFAPSHVPWGRSSKVGVINSSHGSNEMEATASMAAEMVLEAWKVRSPRHREQLPWLRQLEEADRLERLLLRDIGDIQSS